MKDVFERQAVHGALLALLAAGAAAVLYGLPGFRDGAAWGLSTVTWFWLSVLAPILHQLYVMVCWRLELHRGLLSGLLGESALRVYSIGFAVLSLLRLVTLTALAVANRDTVATDRTLLYAAAMVCTALTAYLLYSVARYFTFRRAVGADHFDSTYHTMPLVRQGIFRWTRNGMYTFGLMILWVPGLVAASKTALLSAMFSQIAIWVHYHCTERPDMRRIYGDDPL